MTPFDFTGDHSANTISPKLEVPMATKLWPNGEKTLWVRGGGGLIWEGSSLKLFLKKALKYEVEYWN